MDRNYFEQLASEFVSSVASNVPEGLKSLTFASPLSARTPDVCLLWHDGYRKKHRVKLFLKLSFSISVGFLKGIVKLFTDFNPLGYALYGKINGNILVVASNCGYEKEACGYHTPYVYTERDDAIFVFGSLKDCGKNASKIARLSLLDESKIFCILVSNGLNSFFKMNGDMLDKSLILLEWLLWVLGFQWLFFYYLEQHLSKTVIQYGIRKIGCIHEMHGYSRIVWKVVQKNKTKGYAVQHAAITKAKRWYFPYDNEIENDLRLPDVFYVYNNSVKKLLSPYYKNTTFILGCSYRYANWIDTKTFSKSPGKYYLFVGALAEFDNNVLISSLRKLLKSTTEYVQIRLRLHPQAVLSYNYRNWLKSKAKKGAIEISNNTSLKSDLEHAIVVIGMSTTVLEEALLVGCPVVQLIHPDYLQYIELGDVKGAVKVNYQIVSLDLLRSVNLPVDSKQIRNTLGLDQPLVTYKQLFSEV